MDRLFEDRQDAARKLLPALEKYKGDKNAILLAIPRGALEMGAVLRDELRLPLDIVVTKKIGAPGNEEYAIGAVAPDGSVEVNEGVVSAYRIPKEYIDDEAKRLRHVIRRRYEDYRGDPEPPSLKGKVVIVVDDGIATGFTTGSAIQYIRKKKPKKIVLAVPVSARDAHERLKGVVDEMVCLSTPENFHAVGQFYRVFPQVEDEDARKLLGMRE